MVIVGLIVGVTAFPAQFQLSREETKHPREMEAKGRAGGNGGWSAAQLHFIRLTFQYPVLGTQETFSTSCVELNGLNFAFAFS